MRARKGSEWTLGQMYVHDSAVDVAELLEAEEAGAVGGVIEDIALRLRSAVVPVSLPGNLDVRRDWRTVVA